MNKMTVTKVSLKFTTNCDGCGNPFTFVSHELADLDASRWPTRCEPCRTPRAEAKPRKSRRGKR